MPIIQENPTYFSDRVPDMDLKQVYYSNTKNGYCENGNGSNSRNFGVKRGPLSSDETDSNELEVFLSSCESNTSSCFADNGMQPSARVRGETSFGKSESHSSQSQANNTNGKGLSQKIGKFFWKSKSKHSVGSESHVSGSTIESSASGRGSPRSRCTPDSSLSICTSSMEEGDSSHSSNSNQISPKDILLLERDRMREERNGSVTLLDDQTAFYRFDDCERYAANMYYNMIGEPSSYTFRVQQQSRPRNNSVPVSSRIQEEDCVQPYYNNRTFSTFPNPRRHSIAYSNSNSSSTSLKKEQRDKQQEVIQQDRDGYLRPNEPCNLKNVKNLCYINEPTYSNSSRVQVQVDVHTPTSVSSLNSCWKNEFGDVNSKPRNFETTSGGTITSSTGGEDSQSTLVAGSVYSGLGSFPPHYQNDEFCAERNLQSTSRRGSNESNNGTNSSKVQGKIVPKYMSRSRILSTGTDCEPYCSLCASTTMLASTTKKTRMDVAIVSCQECFFSKNAEAHIRGFFDKLVTKDKQKMDVNLQSYDLKELDRSNVAADVHRSKVQIVIISHYFLTRLNSEASTRVRLSPVNRVFRSKRVIAVLIGVGSTEIIEGYEAVLARFGEWFSVELKSSIKLDVDFCKKFTEQVVRIYNLELCTSSNFSVFPKKVTNEQPKIAIICKKAVESDDDIRVELSTSGRKTEVLTSVKWENPYTAIIRVPESLSPNKTALIEVTVYVNNTKLGATWVKSEFQPKNSDEDVVERMTKMIPGFLKLLDDHVSQTLSKNYLEGSNYQTDSSIEIMNDVLICKQDEFPTIMHFAAYYGLEHTVFTLLDEADGLEQCSKMNEKEYTPADMAAAKGYDHIVQIIGDYQDLTNSFKTLQYIQNVCGRASLLPIQDLHIVSSRCKNAQENENQEDKVVYENDIITTNTSAITNNGEDHENSETVFRYVDEDSSPNSGGSYITMPMLENGIGETHINNETEDNVQEPKYAVVVKPKPRARSPRKSRTNISPETTDEDNPEKVQRRKPKPGRDPKRRHSISPVGKFDNYQPMDMLPDYATPRPTDLDYKIPPPGIRPVAFPSGSTPEDSLPPNFTVFKPKGNGPKQDDNGYLVMDGQTHPRKYSLTEEKLSNETKSNVCEYNGGFISAKDLKESDNVVDRTLERMQSESLEQSAAGGSYYVRKQSDSNGVLDPIDEELIQLMKEFPNSGYSMQQIQLLFENWKLRPDVVRSIEDKKKYMRDMREEYRRIQSALTPNNKKPSTLDRIKGLITGGRKKSTNQSPISPDKITSSDVTNNNQSFVLQRDDIRKLSQSLASERESFGSHESGGSELSEVDSIEKDKENCPKNSLEEKSSQSPKPTLRYNNPLSKRFLPPSYIGPDPSTKDKLTELSILGIGPEPNDDSYKTPPPPRPVVRLDSTPSPPLPKKPSAITSPSSLSPSSSNMDSPPSPPRNAPPIPKKPSHKPSELQDEGSPPPPPPRNYKPANVFNYVDYSQKKKNSPNKPVRQPYDNVTGDRESPE